MLPGELFIRDIHKNETGLVIILTHCLSWTNAVTQPSLLHNSHELVLQYKYERTQLSIKTMSPDLTLSYINYSATELSLFYN